MFTYPSFSILLKIKNKTNGGDGYTVHIFTMRTMTLMYSKEMGKTLVTILDHAKNIVRLWTILLYLFDLLDLVLYSLQSKTGLLHIIRPCKAKEIQEI